MGIDTTRTRIPHFDRTGSPPVHTYDLAADAMFVDVPDVARREVWYELKAPCPTDPLTHTIGLTRFADGRCFVWGEFESGERCWIRDDDEVARRWVAANEWILTAAADEVARGVHCPEHGPECPSVEVTDHVQVIAEVVPTVDEHH